MRVAAVTTTIVEGPRVEIGYEYRLQVEADVPIFPAGAELVAHCRQKLAVDPPAATLSTTAGTIVRVTDYVVELVIANATTAGFVPGTLLLDMARTDLVPAKHLGFQIELPVGLPVTRGV